MAMAVWKGLLRFGLLTLSVKLYRAAQAEKISFRQLHKATGARVRHTVCVDFDHVDAAITANEIPAEETVEQTGANAISTMQAVAPHAGMRSAAVKREELVKGYEYENGRYISFTRQELATQLPVTAREIELSEFVRPAEIDLLLLESSFFVLPDWGSQRAYAVLFQALSRSGLVGVSQITMHSRESVIVFRTHQQDILAQTLFYEPEVRRELQCRRQRSGAADPEVRLALRLIQERAVEFNALKYFDRYRDGVQRMVRASTGGGRLATRTGEDPSSLLQALEKSLQITAGKTSDARNTADVAVDESKGPESPHRSLIDLRPVNNH